MLSDINVLDFTTRLPGPLATYKLQEMGAKVTKLEDSTRGDSFATSKLENFNQWYKNINQGKTIISLDLSNKLDEKKIESLIANANIIILSSYFLKKYSSLISSSPAKVAIVIKGGKLGEKHLHDLNAIGMTKTFHWLMNDTTPNMPHLPIAGINFSQSIVSHALAGLRKAEKSGLSVVQELYLDEETVKTYDLLHSPVITGSKFLHNGLFPCYQVYQLKDSRFVCLAAVEEQFWREFVQIFSLKLSLEDRHDKSGRVLQIIRDRFTQLDSNEVKNLINGRSICLNIVEN